ncbi:MAG: hypothetical protein WAW37_20715 [Syntrophobacteraceae bacterium]
MVSERIVKAICSQPSIAASSGESPCSTLYTVRHLDLIAARLSRDIDDFGRGVVHPRGLFHGKMRTR